MLKARKRLKAAVGGAVLRLRTADPAALIDVLYFCAEAGHRLLATEEEGSATANFIENNGTTQSPKP